MPEHFDGVWELRLIYQTIPTGFTPMEHVMTLDVSLNEVPVTGTLFADINTLARDTATEILSEVCDNLITALMPAFPASTSFSRFELWKIPEGTYAGTFISSYEVEENGTAEAPSVAAWQLTLTFRTLGGGTARLQLMESIAGGNSKISPPYSAAWITTIADAIKSEGSPFLGRDNTFIFSNIHECQGQNEKLWKKRYRA